MQWIGILGISAPLVCIGVLVFVAFLQGLRPRPGSGAHRPHGIRRVGATYAIGAAFLCFSMFYHPRLELAATAQVQQQEQDDEDDSSEPNSPFRQLLRQLLRIRRGERVDRLVLRMEPSPAPHLE